MARRRKNKKTGVGKAVVPLTPPVEVIDTNDEPKTPKVPQESPADTVGNTRRWARALHDGHTDKHGRPYIEHLEAVTQNVYNLIGWDKDLLQAALLHDSIEDTGVSKATLQAYGYNERVVDAVTNVTKMTGEPNYEYIGWVIDSGPDAMIVKLADLYHNTRQDRLDEVKDKHTRDRLIKKYYPAIWRLEQALLASGFDIVETMTFDRALAACKPVTTYTGPKWRNSTSPSVVMKGDLMKFTGDEIEDKFAFKVKSKYSGKDGYVFTFEDTDTKVTLKQGDAFWTKWGGNTGTTGYVSTTKYTPEWVKYMGLPPEYEEGDDLPDPLETFVYKPFSSAPGKTKATTPAKTTPASEDKAKVTQPSTVVEALDALGFDSDDTEGGFEIYGANAADDNAEWPTVIGTRPPGQTKSFSQMLNEVDGGLTGD